MGNRRNEMGLFDRIDEMRDAKRDEKFMRQALKQAEKAYKLKEVPI
jgi:tRNA(adenine34) deaminase